ncbi:MAG TPA: exopolysaccharide biosynthesis GT4 family glycosyltransferase EpsE [Polyangiaceae bacterium]|nr:exopolysaccharide biosynthesis GT4 family glycosyltransferase EpsE [Polyangiaceae bacterium]
MRRIGYLIPEFPGQTHIFFWRERQGLLARGIEPELLSTRKPPPGLVSHDWSSEAMAQTTYLFPPAPALAKSAALEMVRAAPIGWARCLQSIARAEGLDAKGRARLLALAFVGAEVVALAKKRGWLHVHAHTCADGAHIVMFSRLLGGPSYSLTLHGPLHEYGPNQREKWRHAKAAILISKRLDREVREALAGSLPPKLGLAPMGVQVEKFVRKGPYEPWRGQGPLRIFCTARLNFGKGHEFLIRAVKRVRAEGIDARLEIAGEDDAGGSGYRKNVEACIREENMGDFVTLAGAVNEASVREKLEAAHVFAIGSLREGVPVAVMEGMAMSLPVVVTDVGGVTELVTDGEDGWVVPAERPDRLADRILDVARNPERAIQFGAAGRKKVVTQFHSNRSVDVLDEIIPH